MSKKNRRSIKRSATGNLWRLCGMALFVSLLIPGCATPRSTATHVPLDLAGVFPGANAIPGWNISQKVETYNRDNLFNLVDGQADSFFAYNFQQVTTQRYTNAAGILLNVEVWQLAQPADAYGLFTQSRAGTPVTLGNDGDTDPGRRLAFWQDRYYVHVNANKAVPDAQLMTFAQAMVATLSSGGQHPALVDSLPSQGLIARGFIFFHQELSIQDEVWLGGNNILGLSLQTNGVAARYTLDGAPAHLLLVQYPDAGQAAPALAVLRQTTDIDLLAADAQGNTLAAVFGKASQAAATTLLQAALKGVTP